MKVGQALRVSKVIIFLLILSVSAFTLGGKCAWVRGDVCSSQTLSAQNRSNPMDPEVGLKYKIMSLLQYMFLDNSELLSRLKDNDISDEISLIDDDWTEVRLSAAVPLKIEHPVAGEHIDSIIVIPCRTGGEEFYVYLSLYKDTVVRIAGISSKDEYAEDAGKMLKSGIITVDEYNKLRERLQIGVQDIAVVGSADASVNLAAEYLRKIRAGRLEEELKGIIDEKGLFITRGTAFVLSGKGFIIDSLLGKEENAALFLRQILANKGVPLRISEALEKGLREFLKDKKSFSLDKIDPWLKLAVSLVLENGSDVVMNEGGLKFDDPKTMVDIIDIKPDDEDFKSAFSDMQRILKKILDEEVDKSYGVDSAGKATMQRMPGVQPEAFFTLDIVIERLSEGILPTVVMTKDEDDRFTIRVNENFLKLLALFRKHDLHTKKGEIRDVFPAAGLIPSKLGNYYESLIHAVAIHELKHLKIKDGVAILKPDEDETQGLRGGKYNYVNVVSLMFTIIEVIMDEEMSKEGIKRFISDNPLLIARFEDAQKKRAWQNVDQLKGRLSKKDINLGGLPRIEIATPEIIRNIFHYICANNGRCSLSDIYNAVSFEDLPSETIERGLKTLLGWGLIRIDPLYERKVMSAENDEYRLVVEHGDMLMNILYEIPPSVIASDMEGAIMRKLKEFSKKDLSLTNNKKKAEIFKITEPVWTYALLEERKKLEAQAAKAPGEKFKVFIEDGWILPRQMSMVQGLIQQITRKSNGAIEFVRVSAEDLEGEVKGAINKENIKPDHIAVFGGNAAVKKVADGFDLTSVENSPFFIQVNAKELTEESYIPLPAMLAIALQRAFQTGPFYEHPHIKVTPDEKNIRLITLVPKAQSLYDGDARVLYNDIHKKILSDA